MKSTTFGKITIFISYTIYKNEEYIVGEEDYMFLPSVRQIIANHVKTAELFIIQNCGQVVNVEQPVIFNEVVIGYLKVNR